MQMYNINGLTKKQQEKLQNSLKEQGSLWPDFEILQKFVFTKKEIRAVENAKKILLEFKVKCQSLINQEIFELKG